MESNVFRWCFIGTGTLAGQVAKEITRSGRHRIVSVFTRRFEKAESFAKLYVLPRRPGCLSVTNADIGALNSRAEV